MQHRNSSIGVALVLALVAFISASGETPAVSASEQTCSDTTEAGEWAQHLAAPFLGAEEEDSAFRESTDLMRVDSTAAVGAITDPAICTAVRSALQSRLAQQTFPYRLLFMEIGPYYVVAVIDRTPPPSGVFVARRTLAFVLGKTDLAILLDNWLV